MLCLGTCPRHAASGGDPDGDARGKIVARRVPSRARRRARARDVDAHLSVRAKRIVARARALRGVARRGLRDARHVIVGLRTIQ